MTSPLHCDTIMVRARRYAGVDDDGNPVYDTDNLVIGGCNVQPATVAENAQFADANHRTRYKLVAQLDVGLSANLTGDSYVHWNGRWFKPASSVVDYQTDDGLGDHSEVYLEETDVGED